MSKTSNYRGYFLKVGDYTIPFKYMKAQSYSGTLYGQDLDSYRDADGELHREALEKVAPKAEFETPPMMTDEDVNVFLSNIRRNYIDAREKKASVTMWIQELNKYVTHDMYIPDITFTPYYADKNKIIYNPTRIAFISYGGKA